LAEIARVIGAGGGEVWLFKCDHLAAFKQLPICPARSDLVMVTLKCPTGGKIYCFRPKTLVFGAAAAVLGYNIVARTVASIFARLYNIPVISFYDDFAGGAPRLAVKAASGHFEEISSMVGISRKTEKTESGPQIRFLGLDFDCTGNNAILKLPDEKRVAYAKTVSAMLDSSVCRPEEADSLAGRLDFAAGTLWGRAPRVYLRPIYQQTAGHSSVVGHAPRAPFAWWRSFLLSPKERVYYMPSADIGGVLHTDASLFGLGAAWFRPGREPVYYSALAPPGFSDFASGASEIYLFHWSSLLRFSGPLSLVRSVTPRATS